MEIPDITETEVDDHGYKTRISYKVNDKGELIRVTQVIQVITETITRPKAVLERKERLKGRKFGNVKKCKDDSNITVQDTIEVSIVKPQEVDDDDVIGNLSAGLKQFQEKRIKRQLEAKYNISTESDKKKTAYVPPALRNKSNKEEAPTETINYYGLRISNLSRNITEHDIQTLCSYFGDVKNIYIPLNRETNLIKGYAFVRFYKQEAAANALQQLNGYGYDNLILSVEYSKDRPKY